MLLHSHTNSRRSRAGISTVASLASLLLLAPNALSEVRAAQPDKVDFQIFEIDSPLSDIMWCGNTNDVILVQSNLGTIYRSRDRGESWKKLHTIMQQTGMSVIDDNQTVSTLLQSALVAKVVRG
jgi:photosystem II stability/assembly factor-like uncharacterized protein